MSIEVPASRSFGVWYMDSSIHGHAPLAPSIFVGKVCQWIVSPLDDNGCEATIEVISRILAVIVLPVIAAIALLLIPVGLITKSIGGCCTFPEPPKVPVVDPKVDKRLNASGIFRLRGPKPIARPPDPAPVSAPTTYSEKILGWVDPINATLGQVNATIKRNKQKIDIQEINQALHILKTDEHIQRLRGITPPENSDKDEPIVAIIEKINIAEARLKSLKLKFNYPRQQIEANREVVMPSEGDCLFETSCWHSKINGSVIGDALDERALTMDWIKANYATDQQLQLHLVRSMRAHYQAKLEKLEDEEENKQGIVNSGLLDADREQKKCFLERLRMLPAEILSLTMILAQICDGLGVAFCEEINFPAVASLVPGYIVEMSQKGEYGGDAELYALSCRHEVCIWVHPKTNGEIVEKPNPIINPHFTEKLFRRFIYINGHYNAYDDR